MKIRIAIVDDEPLARSGAAARLASHADLQLVDEYGDGPGALAGLQASPVDLVLLDVQMPGMDGLSLLAGLPVDARPLAILLTAHASFAVHAFALGAVDYLLKPIDPARFDEAIGRVRERLASRRDPPGDLAPSRSIVRPTRFAVRAGRATRFVAVDDIDWIEADGDYATLHAGGREYLLRESLQQLVEALDPARFVRVHRSAIVRVDRVAELQPLSNRDAMLRLHDGTPLRASRTHIDALLAALGTHAAS